MAIIKKVNVIISITAILCLLLVSLSYAGIEKHKDKNCENYQRRFFRFTKIIEKNHTMESYRFVNFSGTPTINDSGRVAFLAILDKDGGSTEDSSGIFTGDGRQITIIDILPSGQVFPAYSRPFINNAGVVAFKASWNDIEGVFTGDGGPINTIADTEGPFRSFLVGTPINDKREVAFFAITDDDGSGIFIGSEATPPNTTTTVADTNSPPPFGFDNFAPTDGINNRGTVSFVAEPDDAERAIAVARNISSDGAVVTTTVMGTPFTFFTGCSINRRGTMVFRAYLDTGDSGIFTCTGGPVITIASTDRNFRSFSDASINDFGAVAFVAQLNTGGEGLFVRIGKKTIEVISTSDVLFGSQVTDIRGFGSCQLNNCGQIVFGAELEDGTIGIYRANLRLGYFNKENG